MALSTYSSNNDNRPSVNTFSPISFANPESTINPSRLSIAYFNRLMQISIANRMTSTNENYPTYDNDHAVKVYISAYKAKNLYEMILKMREDSTINNVCVETKNGLLKVSNGVEFGSTSYCVSVMTSDDKGNVRETIYQFKGSDTGYYNYNDGSFSTMDLQDMEYNTFMMTLDQYWLASSYGLAAAIRESNMYQQKGLRDLVGAIAKKVGAYSPNSSGNNKTFLSGDGGGGNNNYQAPPMNNSSAMSVDTGNEYTMSTFDDIANSMM